MFVDPTIPQPPVPASIHLERRVEAERPLHAGVLPFADRLRVENERVRRADEEAAQRINRDRVNEPMSRPVRQPTAFPELPAIQSAARAERTVTQRVVVQSVAPGSLLDVFA